MLNIFDADVVVMVPDSLMNSRNDISPE